MVRLSELGLRAILAAGLGLPLASRASAADAFSWGGTRLILGGEASGSASFGDEGWFNETEYSRSVMHLLRFRLSGELRLGDRVAVVSEVRSENLESPQLYALYLRLHPWPTRSVDLQAGRVPPVFGAYARRRYAADNPLIGEPLAYQYLTTLRTDAMPATVDELLAARGNGWLVSYSVGSSYPAPGVSLASATRWDTGVELHVGSEPVEGSVAVTQGTLCAPRTQDDNPGKQLSARAAFHPAVGLVLGVSAARGEYLSREVADVLPPPSAGTYRQSALGVDGEWSRGYWILRAEAVWSSWDVPAIETPLLRGPLKSGGAFLEGRYRIAPGFYAAARVDHLAFSAVDGSQGTLSWDARVTRVEAGLGLSLLRNLLLKADYQYNWRDGGYVRRQGVGAAQISWWF